MEWNRVHLQSKFTESFEQLREMRVSKFYQVKSSFLCIDLSRNEALFLWKIASTGKFLEKIITKLLQINHENRLFGTLWSVTIRGLAAVNNANNYTLLIAYYR